MATKLSKPVTRELDLKSGDKVGVVAVTVTEEGVEVRKKGSTKKKVFLTWEQVVQTADLPDDAPNKYQNDKPGYLID